MTSEEELKEIKYVLQEISDKQSQQLEETRELKQHVKILNNTTEHLLHEVKNLFQ